MKHITIVTGQHLIFNPRVWKEANLLASKGYRVSIFTTLYSKKFYESDLELLNPNINFAASCSLIYSWNSFLLIIYAKLVRKIANYLYLLLRIKSVYQETYLPYNQLRHILKTKTDLFICHQESGLLLGVKLLQRGFRVAFDFEDWYARDYPNRFRSVQLFQENEAYALHNASFVACPSKAMANALKNYYGLGHPVSVIYNSFPLRNDKLRAPVKNQHALVWFSQNIGPGRGLEEFIDMLVYIDTPLQIHFLGHITPTYYAYLQKSFGKTVHHFTIHAQLGHHAMIEFLRQFSVGLALETPHQMSRDITISNKILLYLQLGMHVVASPTTGHLELKSALGNCITYLSDCAPEKNASLVKELLSGLNFQNKCGMDEFDWAAQETGISNLVTTVLKSV